MSPSAAREPRPFRLDELARLLDLELSGDGSVQVRRLAGLRDAEPGDLTFLSNPRFAALLQATRASAAIVGPDAPETALPRLIASDPQDAFLRAVAVLHPEPARGAGGTHASATVDPSASIDPSATIGPGSVVEAGARIGAGCTLLASCYIGRDAIIGVDCFLHPHAIVREGCVLGARVILQPGAVVGADGFGYAWDGNQHRKVPQIGTVVVGDDVEIGANSTIDRATLGVTRIGRGTKIDNLVHVAHNVEIGEYSILCAQAGISGSARLGRFVVLAGQAGVVGHIEIGDGARIGAQGGVTKSVPAGETVSGYPAQNHTRASRVYAALRHLPETQRSVTDLERRVTRLELDSTRGSDTVDERVASHGREGEEIA